MTTAVAMMIFNRGCVPVLCAFVTATLVSWSGPAAADETVPSPELTQRPSGEPGVAPAPLPVETGAVDAKVLAKKSYEDGVRFYGLGELEKSLAAFERAYLLAPHYAVLFNVGQLRSELAQPVEAARALSLFLEQGAGRIDGSRRREAERVLALNERLIGRLRIDVQPSDAVLMVDGVRWSSVGSEQPLAQGYHVIEAKREGYFQKTETLRIRGGNLSSVRLILDVNTKSEAQPDASLAMGWLSTTCSVSDSTVQIDDWAPIHIEGRHGLIGVFSGSRQLRFERPGYASTLLGARVEPGQTARVDCGLELLSVVPVEHRAVLRVTPEALDSRVLVDDRPFMGGDMAKGPHRVKIVRGQQVLWKKEIDLSPGQVLSISPQEVSGGTTAQVRLLEAQAARRKRFVYLTGGTGLVLLAGAAAALANSASRYGDWKRERDSLANHPDGSQSSPQMADRAVGVQRIEDLGIGLGIAAVAFLGTSVYLWTTGKAIAPKVGLVAAERSQTLLLSW